MATEVQNLEEYDFAAAPQTVQQKPRYRESNQYQEEPEEVANPYEDLTDIPPDDESNIVYDFYIDRPPTAQYKPKERGIDVATQIEHFEPELFDFILEVEPVLQVIVGKTIEQARMELIEEEENETLRQHKATFEKKRKAELMVTQRMEAAHVRRKEEKERRQQQHTLHQQQMKLAQMKLISRQLSKMALRGAKHRVLKDLESLGYLRDDKLMVLKQYSLPNLIQRILQREQTFVRFEKEIESLIFSVQSRAAHEHHRYYSIEMEKRSAILAERDRIRIAKEQRKQRKIEIKRRRLIKEKRDTLRKQIEDFALQKIEQVDSIFGVPIVEGIPEVQAKPYVALATDILQLLTISLDFMLGENPEAIEQSTLLNVWIDLLTNKMPLGLQLQLQHHLQEQIQSIATEMENDPYMFNLNTKQESINSLLKHLEGHFWITYQNNLTYKLAKNHLRQPNLLVHFTEALFNIYFKSVNYKEPPMKEQQILEEAEEGAEPPAPEPEYQRPEVTEQDLEMIEAKKKINLIFKESAPGVQGLSVFLRLFIPFYVPEPEKSLNQSSQQINLQDKSHDKSHDKSVIETKVAPPEVEATPPAAKSKWDFDPKTIDIYDGEKPLVREGKQIPLEDESALTYNFGHVPGLKGILIQDQRANHFARKNAYDFLKERFESSHAIIPFNQYLAKWAELDKDIAYHLEKDFRQHNPESPIFDYEL